MLSCKNISKELEKLYSDGEFQHALLTIAFTYTKDKESAQDLVHDAFYKVQKASKKESTKIKSLKAYLYRTLSNTAKDWKKAQQLRYAHHQKISASQNEEDLTPSSFETKQIFDYIDRLELFSDMESRVFDLWKKSYQNREIADLIEDVPSALFVARTKEAIRYKLRRYDKVFRPTLGVN